MVVDMDTDSGDTDLDRFDDPDKDSFGREEVHKLLGEHCTEVYNTMHMVYDLDKDSAGKIH